MTTKLPKITFRSQRYFVLDTSVLLHDANSIFAFKGVVVAIPFVVLEELDTFKREPGEVGRNARQVIRFIDEIREKGPLSEGVPLNGETEGSILKVIPTPASIQETTLTSRSVDNIIIQTARDLVKQDYTVTFITKDINARVKADALGLEAEDYIKGAVEEKKYYKGWFTISLPARELKMLTANKLPDLVKDKRLLPNEFIIVESENNPLNNRLFRFGRGTTFREVFMPRMGWNFTARNLQQLMALDLLMDDEVTLVCLVGPAGTGKTFLTLLAGLEKVAHDKLYQKFLVSRPIIALGADIGYLPGDVQEKLHNWMMPIRDNLEYIFSHETETATIIEKGRLKRGKRRRYREKPHFGASLTEIEMLQQQGILSLEAITYMRGRSIPYQYIFIDEVQNLTPHEVKSIVSRAGEKSKVILSGDPYQIDSPYLDFSSNGLTITSEKFKGQTMFGTVFLEKSERSRLAELATQLL